MCDLTIANAMAIGRELISHWRVNEEARTGSDHAAIRYTIVDRRVATEQWVRDRPNWKKAKEESYNEAFRAALNKRKDQMSYMMNQEQPIREALEQAADAIWGAHHDARKRTVPVAKLCQHSMQSWDDELSTLQTKRIQAKEACQRHRIICGSIPQHMEREYRTADNTFKRRIKRKKR